MQKVNVGILLSKLKSKTDRINFMREAGKLILLFFRIYFAIRSWIRRKIFSAMP